MRRSCPSIGCADANHCLWSVTGLWIPGHSRRFQTHGEYRHEVAEYANQIARWRDCGNLLAAVSQDYMCEPFILEKTGMTVEEHQQKTISRYDELLRCETGVYIMPVLQGYEPSDYVRHIRLYGGRLASGAWVGVGSICKRNGNIRAIEEVLLAIHHARPDLRLHGFGLKSTTLSSALVQDLLHRRFYGLELSPQGWSEGNGNDWRELRKWTRSRLVHFSLTYSGWPA